MWNILLLASMVGSADCSLVKSTLLNEGYDSRHIDGAEYSLFVKKEFRSHEYRFVNLSDCALIKLTGNTRSPLSEKFEYLASTHSNQTHVLHAVESLGYIPREKMQVEFHARDAPSLTSVCNEEPGALCDNRRSYPLDQGPLPHLVWLGGARPKSQLGYAIIPCQQTVEPAGVGPSVFATCVRIFHSSDEIKGEPLFASRRYSIFSAANADPIICRWHCQVTAVVCDETLQKHAWFKLEFYGVPRLVFEGDTLWLFGSTLTGEGHGLQAIDFRRRRINNIPIPKPFSNIVEFSNGGIVYSTRTPTPENEGTGRTQWFSLKRRISQP